jgi:hypothetical protein
MVSSSAPRLRTQYVFCHLRRAVPARTPALSIRAFMVISPSIVRSASQERQGGYSLIGLACDPTQRVGPHKRAADEELEMLILFATVGRPSNGEENEEEKPQNNPQTARSRADQSCSFERHVVTKFRRSYDHAIRDFIEWYCSEPRQAFNRTVVTRYGSRRQRAYYR